MHGFLYVSITFWREEAVTAEPFTAKTLEHTFDMVSYINLASLKYTFKIHHKKNHQFRKKFCLLLWMYIAFSKSSRKVFTTITFYFCLCHQNFIIGYPSNKFKKELLVTVASR